MTRIKRLKDWLKESLAPTLPENRKLPLWRSLAKSRKQKTQNTESPELVELRTRYNAAYENLKEIDKRLKSAKPRSSDWKR